MVHSGKVELRICERTKVKAHTGKVGICPGEGLKVCLMVGAATSG